MDSEMNDQKLRDEFDAWYGTKHGINPEYANPDHVYGAWNAWQAATSTHTALLESLRADIEIARRALRIVNGRCTPETQIAVEKALSKLAGGA